MAETTSAAAANLPPPPTTGVAPGQAGLENGSQNHMPPPLNIPQNNSTIPPALSAEMMEMMSPTSAIRRMAPEPNKRALYVGGLDPRVTEDVLKQIFETTGHVQNVKIIPDKNVSPCPIPLRHVACCQQSRCQPSWLPS
jgi:nucleolysin TIA-1/TIAR